MSTSRQPSSLRGATICCASYFFKTLLLIVGFSIFSATLTAQIPTREVLEQGIKSAHSLSTSELDARLARPEVDRNTEIYLRFARLQNSLAAKNTAAVAPDVQRILSVADSFNDPTTLRLTYAELAATLSPAVGAEAAAAERNLRALQQANRNREESARLQNMTLLRQEQVRAAEAEMRRKDQQIEALRAKEQLVEAEKMRQLLTQAQVNQQVQIEGMKRSNEFKNTLSSLLLICLLLSILLAWSLWRANISRRQQALEDPLTCLKNRRFLSAFMEHETERLRRSGLTALILIADVDLFKNVNDKWGHDSGDDALVQFADVIRYCVRNSDVVVRWGGEEFVIVCPQSDESHAAAICNRIRHQLQTTSFHTRAGEEFHLTVSIGAALFSPSSMTENWEATLARADKALLSVKNNGRDNWTLAPATTGPCAASEAIEA